MFGSLGGGATWAEGVYELQYAKVDGVWKISKLDYHSGFGAPIRDRLGGAARSGIGYARSASAGSAPPPQRPAPHVARPRGLAHPPIANARWQCEGFPAACIAPFHYENPGKTASAGHAWDTDSMRPP